MGTGFDLFSTQCRYRQIGYGPVIADCTSKSFGKVYYCSHDKNIFTYNKKTYCKRCFQYRCPYYSKEQQDESYCRVMNLRLSLLNINQEDEQKTHDTETHDTDDFYKRGWSVYRTDQSKAKLTGELLEKLIKKYDDSCIKYDKLKPNLCTKIRDLTPYYEIHKLVFWEGVLLYERKIPEIRRQPDFRYKHGQGFTESTFNH